jgi:hypothetical protein
VRQVLCDEGVPYVIEFAFGVRNAGLIPGSRASRIDFMGANWSTAIGNPFRSFGSTGEGLETILAKVHANANEPVICALHLACARIQFADRGKSSIILTNNASQYDD